MREKAKVAAEVAPAPAAAAAAAVPVSVPAPAALALLTEPVVATAAPTVLEVSPLQSSTALLAEFNNSAAAGGSLVLSQAAFVALVKQLFAPTNGVLKPSDADLAFGVRRRGRRQERRRRRL
jgi:hypothetical protein